MNYMLLKIEGIHLLIFKELDFRRIWVFIIMSVFVTIAWNIAYQWNQSRMIKKLKIGSLETENEIEISLVYIFEKAEKLKTSKHLIGIEYV